MKTLALQTSFLIRRMQRHFMQLLTNAAELRGASMVVAQVLESGRQSTQVRPGKNLRVVDFPKVCWDESVWMCRGQIQMLFMLNWRLERLLEPVAKSRHLVARPRPVLLLRLQPHPLRLQL